jgi:hypothetical protein
MGYPNGWTDDGNTLTAPNGNTVVGVIRDYVVSHNPQWPAGLTPISTPVTATNGDVQQLFGLAVNLIKENSSTTETAGSVPPAQSPSQQAVDNAVSALTNTASQLSQVLDNLNTLLAAVKASSGAD